MKRKLIRKKFALQYAGKICSCATVGKLRKCTVLSLLLFCVSTFTSIQGQIVSYSYDQSGNVILKQVTYPQTSSIFKTRNNHIQLPDILSARIQFKEVTLLKYASAHLPNMLLAFPTYNMNGMLITKQTTSSVNPSHGNVKPNGVSPREKKNGPN